MVKKITNTHGGARKNAGAKKKPAELKKIGVMTYHCAGDVELIGIESAREIAHAAIERKIKKVKNI